MSPKSRPTVAFKIDATEQDNAGGKGRCHAFYRIFIKFFG